LGSRTFAGLRHQTVISVTFVDEWICFHIALKEGPPAMRGRSLGHEAALRWAYLAGFVWLGLTAVLAFSIL